MASSPMITSFWWKLLVLVPLGLGVIPQLVALLVNDVSESGDAAVALSVLGTLLAVFGMPVFGIVMGILLVDRIAPIWQARHGRPFGFWRGTGVFVLVLLSVTVLGYGALAGGCLTNRGLWP